MKMLSFVLYKEFLVLKCDKRIAQLVLQSVAYGLLLPILMYLVRIDSVLPLELGGIDLTKQEKVVMVKGMLENFYPLILPFFMSVAAAMLVIPAIVQETESRTLERLLSLPLSWIHIVMGKFLFFFAVSLASSYLIVLIYFRLASVIMEEFRPPDFGIYLLLLVPAVSFYTVSAALFASVRARCVCSANVIGGFLTVGLFFLAFFLSWFAGVELGRDIIATFGLLLFVVGATLLYHAARVNPEKLLYGHSS